MSSDRRMQLNTKTAWSGNTAAINFELVVLSTQRLTKIRNIGKQTIYIWKLLIVEWLYRLKFRTSFNVWTFKPLRILPKIRTLKSNVVDEIQMEAYQHSPVQVDACSSAMLENWYVCIMSYKHAFQEVKPDIFIGFVWTRKCWRWCPKKARWLLPEEMLSTMGIPVTQKQAEMALIPKCADLSQLSHSAKARSNKRSGAVV